MTPRSNPPRKGEGYIYYDSCCYSVVLVDQSAEPGNTDYLTVGTVRGQLGVRGLEGQPTMRALLVVVSHVLPEDSLKVAFAEDKDVVQRLMPDGLHETLGKGICLG